MSKLDDLYTLERLLKEFELPVSPILEYAIKNKKEDLLNSTGNRLNVEQVKNVEKLVTEISDVKADKIKRVRKKASILRVCRPNGTIIEEEKAAATMCKAIVEIGIEKVFELKIPMDGMFLVTKGGNSQYPTAQHEVGNGLFVNVHSNNITKKRQLERIFNSLDLNWKVEIVESN